jgi:hypothetical protein
MKNILNAIKNYKTTLAGILALLGVVMRIKSGDLPFDAETATLVCDTVIGLATALGLWHAKDASAIDKAE